MTVGAVHKEFGIWYWKRSLLFNYLDKIHTDGGVLFWPLSQKKFEVYFHVKVQNVFLCTFFATDLYFPAYAKVFANKLICYNLLRAKYKMGASISNANPGFYYLQITWWGIFPASVSSCFAFFLQQNHQLQFLPWWNGKLRSEMGDKAKWMQ